MDCLLEGFDKLVYLGMLNLEDDTFGTAGIQSGKVLKRPWTLELEVFCTGWTVFLVPSEPL